MNRKYVPLKKLMQEKKDLGVVRLPPGIRPMPQFGKPKPMPETIPVGFQIPFGTPAGGLVPAIPDIIDAGDLIWRLLGKGNQSGDNPIVLPGVPQGGGGVHGQQPTNPNY
jgi:hypothetical protein